MGLFRAHHPSYNIPVIPLPMVDLPAQPHSKHTFSMVGNKLRHAPQPTKWREIKEEIRLAGTE
jgi:hypothetical protein